MSPAGSGTALFLRRPCVACIILAVIVLGALLAAALGTLGGRTAKASPLPVAHALAGWQTFQDICEAGPSEGQGSSASACVCWEQNLAAQDIGPTDAIEQLDTADYGQGAAYTVGENLSGSAVGWAMQGCGLAG